MAARSGLPVCPEIVAELGPGDSLGVAIAAILSGVREYYAFDVVAYAHNDNNLRVLDECLQLFASRADIPGDEEFPKTVSTPGFVCFSRRHIDSGSLGHLLESR